LSYSLNNGDSFSDLPDQPIVERSAFNNSIFEFTDLKTKNQVLIRLYAFESLYGTATEKDFWIIDNIELYGSANSSTAVTSLETTNSPSVFFSSNKLHIKGIKEETKLTVYNFLGMQLTQKLLFADDIISVNSSNRLLILKFSTDETEEIVKVTPQ
jgi:hypothetical protein